MKKTTKSKYESEYKMPERFVVVNDEDPDLVPVKIPIPSSIPDWSKIDGYGLPAKDQKFKRPKIPKRLKKIEREIKDLIAIEEFLDQNADEYRKELQFIEREWDRRENGYWFFNNGVPTYITGTHYLYISYWEIDIGIPDYRDRDRKVFLFLDMAERDNKCLGVVYPKHRREGATNKAQCWIYDDVSSSKRHFGGIQSATETHARDVFQKHLVPGWRSLPFFFKPKFEGSTNPKSEISFNEPSIRVTKGKMSSYASDYLGSYIDFKSSDVKAYDSRKLHRSHQDEAGKTTEIDINERWETVRECHVVDGGASVIGKTFMTSTVEEMLKKGGANFKKICDASHYDHYDERYSRDKNGMTRSGMYLLFIPAHEGLIVDEYGNSLKEESLKYIENRRAALIKAEDHDGLSSYIRKYPIRYRECWRGDSSDCKFNIKILEERLDRFKFGNDLVTQGDFVWKDGKMGGVTDPINNPGDFQEGRVKFVPSKTGKFKVSFLFEDPKESNSYYIEDSVRYPGKANLFSAGGDPFKFQKTENSNRSDGGGAVFMNRDFNIDPPDRDIKEWESYRFVCTYLHRSRSKFEFGEDMLMMCVYYGCLMVSEINVALIWDHFEERGFSGYLFYLFDKKTGRFKKTPGVYMGTEQKEEIFREYQQYIEKHGHRERHDDLLNQCLEIGDDMRPYDLFAAGGLALKGVKGETYVPEPPKNNENEGGENQFVREYTY